ncbi:MAG: hypothetical protein ACRDKZ_01195 [Actinomycetota bacterium]
MTSAELILVSVASALVAVTTMLLVASALRARSRDSEPRDSKK